MNPHTDESGGPIAAAREFAYDVRHPRQSFRRFRRNSRGENPDFHPGHKWLGYAMIAEGALFIVTVTVLKVLGLA